MKGNNFSNSGHFQPRGLPKFVVLYLLTPRSGVLLQALVSPRVCVNHLHLQLSTLPGFSPTCFSKCWKNKLFVPSFVLNLVSTPSATAPQFLSPYWKRYRAAECSICSWCAYGELVLVWAPAQVSSCFLVWVGFWFFWGVVWFWGGSCCLGFLCFVFGFVLGFFFPSGTA